MSDNTITDLFQRDPLQLSRTEFESIIEHYRKQRHNFNIAAKVAKTTAGTKKVEKANLLADQLNINLDDIEI